MKRFLDRLRRYAGSPRAVWRSLALLAAARTIRRSPLFDRAWYLRENPDLAARGESPELHYLFCGAAAGQDPGPGFCGAEYLALNPDARASGLNPLLHYERIGRRRGARISFLQPLLADGRADPSWRFPSLEEHQASFPGKIAAIRAKTARGERIRAVFLVTDPAVFPARPLFAALLRDHRFDARIAVFPEAAWSDDGAAEQVRRCEDALAREFPAAAFVRVRPGLDGDDPDVTAGADVVCYPRIYNTCHFRCNPRWSVRRPFLPIYANYGHPCTIFARPVLALANYAYQWRVFLESDNALALYREVSRIGGANGAVVGSLKMDTLAETAARAEAERPRDGRKCVLLAPHHSVAGGSNDILSLSNFLRLADFFADLPARFPDVDFLFRPHPFLFPVLERPNFWGKARCEAWRARFLAHPNARWTDGGDPLRDFAASDAIVQDCASFLADWMFTGKPCCYVLRDEADVGRKFNEIGRQCLEWCNLAFGEAEIAAFVRDVVLGGNDPKKAGREAFRRQFAVNWPHAAETALHVLAESLDDHLK